MRIFTRLTLTMAFSFMLSMLAMSQKTADYNINLVSGKFVPNQNVEQFAKTPSILDESKFAGKYYVAIQFNQLPTAQEKIQLKNAGIELLDYLPKNAYLAIVAQNFNSNVLASSKARAIFQLKGIQKTPVALMNLQFPEHAVKENGTVDLQLTTYEKFSIAALSASFASVNALVIDEAPSFKNITVRIPQQNFLMLLDLPFISWVEAIDAPNKTENLLGRTLHRVNVLNDGIRNLKGEGINIGIWDEGEVFKHIDFSQVAQRLFIQEPGSVSSHSSHCGGTIAGGGFINPKARGMASKSKLYSWNFSGNIQSEMAAGISALGLSVSSHSYGSTLTCGLTGSGVAYSTTSRNTDLNLNNFPNHLHVHSAGNSQTSCTGGWSTITSSGKSAKNNILVANISSVEVINGTSSFGPVADGRVKPEISSFGTNVLSTYPNNQYGTISGTSMATPGVAGSVALLVQRYRQLNSSSEPPSALIKNTILNTANDLGNIGPDYKFGYGRLNVLEAVKILEENRYAINSISTGVSNDVNINIPAGAAKLRVMLTWNDPAALANANPALVNDLDLSVVNGATSSLPWILDPTSPATPATRGVDTVSNIEQVIIDNPTAGAYTLRVAGTAIPSGPQQYSLTWSVEMPYIEVIYPNGNESFNPGVSETITWNNAGVTGNQTVEYSLNNGANWTLISSTIPANTTRLSWSPPSANTSTALVRVSSGSLTDNSDATFKILAVPTGLTSSASCVAGDIVFNWTASANATQYDLIRIDTTNGTLIVEGADIAATTYTVTGLAPGSTHYFCLVAKNNSSNAVSDRSVAIPFVIPSTGTTLGAIGSINGLSNVCGTPSNVSYSVVPVTGASSYSWTVPTGITIASGQGTNAITVNFTGPVSGNITCFASAGTCQTALVTLNVSASGTAVNAPSSGGNQSVVSCSTTVPTLTATASVPAGHNLVWYDMATGGSVVANPTLSSVGSVTFYAASVNTASGCESATRTAVTLAITAAPPPTIASAGPLFFCQGGSVVLTASAGNSYSWSNGAITQSITVTQSGNYTVAVNQGGCTGTSAAVVVQVNPLPTISITASGSTTLCQGGSVLLTATAGNSYNWSNGATTQSITVSQQGTYTVTVNQGNSCVNTSAATNVVVNPLPAANIGASGPTTFCDGDNVVLTASSGSSYLWSTGATTQSITVTTGGSYTVNVTGANGCIGTSTPTAVTVNPLPTVNITASPYTALYPGLTTTLSANAINAATYTWYKNGLIVANASNASLTIAMDDIGSYTVKVEGSGGCSNLSSAVVIRDSAMTKLFIFPNPNQGQFNVSYYNGINAKSNITVFDSKGAKVFNKQYNLATIYQKMPVDIRRNSKGVYHVLITDDKGKKIASASVVVQ